MKKNTHPFKNSCTIVLSNGSTFLKKVNLFKKILKTDFDFLKNSGWLTKNIK